MTVIQKILDLMNQHNITAHQLEKQIGLSNASIQAWRNGRGKPSADALAKLATYFDVPVDYLLGTGLFAKQELIQAHLKEIIEPFKKMKIEGSPILVERINSYFNIIDSLPIYKQIEFLNLFIRDIEYDETLKLFRYNWKNELKSTDEQIEKDSKKDDN